MKIKIRIPAALVLVLALFLVTPVFLGQACTSQSLLGTNLEGSSSARSVRGGGTTITPIAPIRQNAPNPFNMGMNTPGLIYYNNVPVYADLALGISGNNGPWDAGNAAATLDSTGAPTAARWSAISSYYPSGAYTVSWDGTGTFSASINAVMGSITKTIVNGVQHNVAIMTTTQTKDAWFNFNATTPITNIHIMSPASVQYGPSMFTKDFISNIQGFFTLRFMDSFNTNGSSVQNWSDRTWPTEGSRADRSQGMAYEDVVALANVIGQDIYVNIPGMATDDYVCRLARLFRYGEFGNKSNSACSLSAPSSATAGSVRINSTSKIIFEYSNETWNSGLTEWEDAFCMKWGIPDQNYRTCRLTSPTSVIGKAALANSSLGWNSNVWGRSSEFAMVLTKRVSDITKTVFSSRSYQVKMAINIQSAPEAHAD